MLTRREMLRGAVAMGGAALLPSLPARAATVPDDVETAALLKEFIYRRAFVKRDPWLDVHAVLALGRDTKVGDGSVLDDVVRNTLELETLGFQRFPRFPLEKERHPMHFLQVMRAVGVPLDRRFETRVGAFSHEELVRGAEATLVPDDITDELSWVVSVLCATHAPDADVFHNGRGDEIKVADLVHRHLRETEGVYRETIAAMELRGNYGRGVIHTKACNGTHLLYGLIDALRHGYDVGDLRRRLQKLVDATVFRLRAEPLLIDKAMGGSDPFKRLNGDAAKFTLIGHVLEDLSQGLRFGLITLSTDQRAVLTQARATLRDLVERFSLEHDLDGLREKHPAPYRVILGDACHALRGLEAWIELSGA